MEEDQEGYYCNNWWNLALNDDGDRNQAFNNILVDRQVFVAHIHNCEACHKRVGRFFSELKTDEEFVEAVKSLRSWRKRAI